MKTLIRLLPLLVMLGCQSPDEPAQRSYWQSMKDSFLMKSVPEFVIDSALRANYKSYPKIKNRVLDSAIYAAGEMYLYSWQERDTTKNEFVILVDGGDLGLKQFYFVFTRQDSLLSCTQVSGLGGEGATRYETRSKFLHNDTLFTTRATTQFLNTASGAKTEIGDTTFFRIYFDRSGKTIEEEIAAPRIPLDLTGTWTWSSPDTTEGMWLALTQTGDSLRGTYCAYQYDGRRYDCGENGPACPVWGKLTGNKSQVLFTSCYSLETGKAELTYDTINGTLTWEAKDLKIQHYTPYSAALVREKR